MSKQKPQKRDTQLRLLNIGFGNVVSVSRIIAIVSAGSAPIKRLKDEAKDRGKLIDATEGRKTRAIIITDSDHVILSAIQTETIIQRLTEVSEDYNGESKKLS